MNFHILTEIHDGAWGGGNQFQKALREYLRKCNLYAEEIEDADVILVNSHHWGDRLWELFNLKHNNPDIVVLHRIDGPVSVVRDDLKQIVVDRSIMEFNRRISDGTVFQSEWSREQCLAQGMDREKSNVVVHNAPDPKIFYPPQKKLLKNKVRLVASSWSTNKRKGFDIYEYLDENLDFSRYDFTFIGNSPKLFKNIEHKQPMTSDDFANELRTYDLYIHASHMESCSNALIEAMSCGLVPVALNNTSHPEIVSSGGLLFNGTEDVLLVIEQAVKQFDNLYSKLQPPRLDDVGRAYADFAQSIYNKYQDKIVAKPSWFDWACVWWYWKLMQVQPYWNRLVSVTFK